MRLIYYYIILSFLFSDSNDPYFEIFELDKKTIKSIESGDIVTVKTDKNYGDARHYQVYGIINQDISKVFDAIENFDNYPEFMPRFDYAESIEVSDSLISYIFHITLPMNIKYKYKIKMKRYKSNSYAWLAWETIPWEGNSINETWGQWYLTPYNDNNKTLVQYQVYTDPGYIPFGFEWIINIMSEKSLPETVKNLKTWVENNEK